MNKNITVIDYGIGNVFSVCNALSQIGANPILSEDPQVIKNSDRIILPGVGAFSQAMNNLRKKGLDHSIKDFVNKGRPFLGICLGMQILMDKSTELGNHSGLGIIPGEVKRISKFSETHKRIKVPHIGWAKIICQNETSNLFKFITLQDKKYNFFYFVHSYACNPSSDEHLIASTDYWGNKIVAVIGHENILGVQFHPERSGPSGLRLLNRFMKI